MLKQLRILFFEHLNCIFLYFNFDRVASILLDQDKN